jgi:uncharacterized protein (DUF983 family)
MSSKVLPADELRVARRASNLRLVAAGFAVAVFAFVVLTFASSVTVWMCIAIAAVVRVGLIAVLARLRQTRATLFAMQLELRADG